MLRFLFLFLPALAAILCSCSSESDAPYTPDPCAIAFLPSGDTRAEITTRQDITAFRVWGWANNATGGSTPVFLDKSVERAAGAWHYTPQAYWIPRRTYRFLALATSKPAASGLTVTAPRTFTTWPQAQTATLTLTPPYDEDLLYAHAVRQTPDTLVTMPPVPLTFRHALARLKVRVREATIDNCHVLLRRVTFTPRNAAATFTPALVAHTTTIPPLTIDGEPTTSTTYDVELTLVSTLPCTTPYTLFSNDDPDSACPSSRRICCSRPERQALCA